MRLKPDEIIAIKAAAREAFGPDAVVRLFGSRVRDDLRGGDIDLHLEVDESIADIDHEILFRRLLWKRLDEPQVDVVIAGRNKPARWIDRAALREGIIL